VSFSSDDIPESPDGILRATCALVIGNVEEPAEPLDVITVADRPLSGCGIRKESGWSLMSEEIVDRCLMLSTPMVSSLDPLSENNLIDGKNPKNPIIFLACVHSGSRWMPSGRKNVYKL
jgi:hypothetical protein